jgi:hypothetical protein
VYLRATVCVAAMTSTSVSAAEARLNASRRMFLANWSERLCMMRAPRLLLD